MSNFQTFTGSSRRPRNVNLSGQPSVLNPFAQGPGGWPGNPARTVTKAQADRQQRQRERERNQAAKLIQGAFRCYQAREAANNIRRQHFDRACESGSPAGRVQNGLPMLLRFYNAKNSDDVKRIRGICNDIAALGTAVLSFMSPGQTSKLVRSLDDILLITPAVPEENASLLDMISSIITTSPNSVGGLAQYHYKSLLRLSKEQCYGERWTNALAQGALAPLEALQLLSATGASSATPAVYRAFAFEYLTGPDLASFETKCSSFSKILNIDELSSIISKVYSTELARSEDGKDGLLWLLAHFIQLCSSSSGYQAAAVLETLYVQISTLGRDIRRRYAVRQQPGDASPRPNETWSSPLQPYVRGQLDELVSKNTIQNLLNQLSVKGQTNATMNLLAGYLLTLLRVFPGSSDDIRMLIYQCDLPSTGGDQPIVKNFWQLSTATSIYHEVLSDQKAPARLLRNYLSAPAGQRGDAQESEWRVILLFLELYNFTLRVAGDDDFMNGVKPGPLLTPGKQPRLQACCLSLEAVSSLSGFLKNLSFSLYHDAKEISAQPGYSASLKPGPPSSAGQPIEATTRLDLDGLKSIIPTTMQLIYERDSRLRFLPADHWLMTSRFKMDDFIANVVEEWQRRQEADTAESDDEEEGDHMSDWRSRQRREMARSFREQHLATIGPKIEILQHMPFTIPFETRAKIFKHFVLLDQAGRRGGDVEADSWRQRVHPRQAQKHHGKIQRGRIFDDAYAEFYTLNDGLKEPIYITFLDPFGEEEAGIDGGGVTKEFLISAISEAFRDGEPWFTRNAQGIYYPNPGINAWHREMRARPGSDDQTLAAQQKEALQKLEFLGRLVGKCLYEGILIDVTFAGFFLMRWRTEGDKEYKCTINDLRDADEDLYRGLIRLKNEAGDVSEWDMFFTINDELWFGDDKETMRVTRNLIPDGDSVKVTNENRLLFVALTAQHRLVTQPAAETRAFVRGLQTIIDPSWLSMFNQAELQRLVGGDSSEIDLEDMKRNTTYSGIYSVGDDGVLHPTIQLFWKVMEDFRDDQRRDVLKFVTSTPRAPLLGFSQLNPRFGIRDSGGGAMGIGENDEERLPSASTCINLLKLPRYRTKAAMRQKLLQAISSGAGFDLS